MAKDTAGSCMAHGRRCFVSRRAARRTIRTLDERGMDVYRCDERGDVWHIGHSSPKVRGRS